jgi:DNA polymerase-3 subunit beta
MKINILKEKLKKGLNIVEKISQKSLKLPILQNILFKTEKDLLKLSTTNLESSISWQSLADIEKEGSICIPTKILSSFVNSLPEEKIAIKTDKKNNLKVQCGNYNTKIKSLDSEDFPIIPNIENGQEITIDNKKFCEAVDQIVNIPSSSSTKPEITGILFSFQKNEIKMVATDSFRLAEKKIAIKTGLSEDYSLILPQSAAKELTGILSGEDGDLKIKFSPNQISFKYILNKTSKSEVKFTSRLVEGKYPNYKEIIPEEYKTTLIVDKDKFLNQVKSASLFSGKINEVKLDIKKKDKKIKISSQHPDLGEHESFLEGDIDGKNLSISFNYRFLIDGISAIKDKKIKFELTTKEGPAALKSINKKPDYLYIIMPIKPNN